MCYLFSIGPEETEKSEKPPLSSAGKVIDYVLVYALKSSEEETGKIS